MYGLLVSKLREEKSLGRRALGRKLYLCARGMRVGCFISVVILTIRKNICDPRKTHQGLLKYWEREREREREQRRREGEKDNVKNDT